MGGRFVAKGAQDALEHAVRVPKHLVVPETHDFVAPSFEPRCALFVFFDRERVLPAVDLNDQVLCQAREIDDVRTDRHLSSEAITEELLAPEQ